MTGFLSLCHLELGRLAQADDHRQEAQLARLLILSCFIIQDQIMH